MATNEPFFVQAGLGENTVVKGDYAFSDGRNTTGGWAAYVRDSRRPGGWRMLSAGSSTAQIPDRWMSEFGLEQSQPGGGSIAAEKKYGKDEWQIVEEQKKAESVSKPEPATSVLLDTKQSKRDADIERLSVFTKLTGEKPADVSKTGVATVWSAKVEKTPTDTKITTTYTKPVDVSTIDLSKATGSDLGLPVVVNATSAANIKQESAPPQGIIEKILSPVTKLESKIESKIWDAAGVKNPDQFKNLMETVAVPIQSKVNPGFGIGYGFAMDYVEHPVKNTALYLAGGIVGKSVKIGSAYLDDAIRTGSQVAVKRADLAKDVAKSFGVGIGAVGAGMAGYSIAKSPTPSIEAGRVVAETLSFSAGFSFGASDIGEAQMQRIIDEPKTRGYLNERGEWGLQSVKQKQQMWEIQYDEYIKSGRLKQEDFLYGGSWEKQQAVQNIWLEDLGISSKKYPRLAQEVKRSGGVYIEAPYKTTIIQEQKAGLGIPELATPQKTVAIPKFSSDMMVAFDKPVVKTPRVDFTKTFSKPIISQSKTSFKIIPIGGFSVAMNMFRSGGRSEESTRIFSRNDLMAQDTFVSSFILPKTKTPTHIAQVVFPTFTQTKTDVITPQKTVPKTVVNNQFGVVVSTKQVVDTITKQDIITPQTTKIEQMLQVIQPTKQTTTTKMATGAFTGSGLFTPTATKTQKMLAVPPLLPKSKRGKKGMFGVEFNKFTEIVPLFDPKTTVFGKKKKTTSKSKSRRK